MNNFQVIFSDGVLQRYIQSNLKDPWINTPFEGYTYLNPKQKGNFGEQFVSKLLESNHTIEKPSNTGHDRIIDTIKSEIKFSLACKGIKDKFTINHVSKNKDWDRLIFCGINPKEEDIRIGWFSKSMFIEYLQDPTCKFNYQQGGNKIKNDDYMCMNITELFPKLMQSMESW